jgi:preprotein translocase subunit SecA
VRGAEQAVTLASIDHEWRDHLARCADLREGIHLVRLGGQDPLSRFTAEAIRAFGALEDAVDAAVLDALRHVRVGAQGLDLTDVGIKGPSSTWTYLVNDDPFRNQIGLMLTGPGRTTVAIYSAALLWPLLLVWGILARLRRRATKLTK